jgi:hypothetical protein
MVRVVGAFGKSMNAWSVSLSERSAGAFHATATRDTGNKVERTGGKGVLTTVLHDAYEKEVSLGTIRGDAAYVITKAAKPGWNREHHESAFGSWSIHSPDRLTRIDYDGKDFFLMVQKGSKTDPAVIWQGEISALTSLAIDYFETLQGL